MNIGLRFSLYIVFSLILSGCSLSIESSSNYDHEYSDRLHSAEKEIVEHANAVLDKKFPVGIRDNINPIVNSYVIRHFEKADEIAKQHIKSYIKSMPFYRSEDMDRRHDLLERTSSLETKLMLVRSDSGFATSYPNGVVVISTPIIYLFDFNDSGYDSALLGILIHELLHIRDSHALQQWLVADGRKDLLIEGTKNFFASLVSILPGLSIDRNHFYGSYFKSSPYLEELSEYSADLGSLSLLNKEGFDGYAYASFLKDVKRTSERNGSKMEKPFSWLSGRVQCIDQTYLDVQYVQSNSNNHDKISSVRVFAKCAIKNIFDEEESPSSEGRISESDLALFYQYK